MFVEVQEGCWNRLIIPEIYSHRFLKRAVNHSADLRSPGICTKRIIFHLTVTSLFPYFSISVSFLDVS